MANSDNSISALADEPSRLLGLTDATGAAIVFDGRTVCIGYTPMLT